MWSTLADGSPPDRKHTHALPATCSTTSVSSTGSEQPYSTITARHYDHNPQRPHQRHPLHQPHPYRTNRHQPPPQPQQYINWWLSNSALMHLPSIHLPPQYRPFSEPFPSPHIKLPANHSPAPWVPHGLNCTSCTGLPDTQNPSTPQPTLPPPDPLSANNSTDSRLQYAPSPPTLSHPLLGGCFEASTHHIIASVHLASPPTSPPSLGNQPSRRRHSSRLPLRSSAPNMACQHHERGPLCRRDGQ